MEQIRQEKQEQASATQQAHGRTGADNPGKERAKKLAREIRRYLSSQKYADALKSIDSLISNIMFLISQQKYDGRK